MKTHTQTTQQPNFETLLPKRDQYEDTLAKDNLAFYDNMFSYFDQSKWEDRFAMMIRIARNTKLEKDERPSIGRVANLVCDLLDSEIPHLSDGTPMGREILIEDIAEYCNVEEDLEKHSSTIETLVDNWKVGVHKMAQSSNFLIIVNLYNCGYPSSLVTETSMGTFIERVTDGLNKVKIERETFRHRIQKIDSLMLSIDCIQTKTANHIAKGEQLILHKEDIDWKSLAIARITIDDYDWYARNYEESNLIEDWYSNPFGIHFYTSFQMDYVLYKLCKTYGVKLSDYISDVADYYHHLWVFNEYAKEDEDSFFDLTDIFSDCLKHWKEKYPLLA